MILTNVLLTLFFFFSCSSKKSKVKNITGFWKFQITNPVRNGEEVGHFYGEIKDTTLVFWHENSAYLPPLRFLVSNDSIFVKSLSVKSKKNSEFEYFGTLKDVSKNGFEIMNTEEHYVFTRSSKEVFKKESKTTW